MAFNGFWMALSERDGTMLVGSERQFIPGPSMLEYPGEFMGTLLETSDGAVIKQQPSMDPRRRSWVWENFPGWFPQYEELWPQLESLLSKFRWEAGLSPFVWLRDTASGEFSRKEKLIGTATGGTTTVLNTTGLTAGRYAGGSIEIIGGTGVGQQRYIQSNTATTITPSLPFTTAPNGTSQYLLRWDEPTWFRVRVLDVARKIAPGGGPVRYAETRMAFVVDDPNWNAI